MRNTLTPFPFVRYWTMENEKNNFAQAEEDPRFNVVFPEEDEEDEDNFASSEEEDDL